MLPDFWGTNWADILYGIGLVCAGGGLLRERHNRRVDKRRELTRRWHELEHELSEALQWSQELKTFAITADWRLAALRSRDVAQRLSGLRERYADVEDQPRLAVFVHMASQAQVVSQKLPDPASSEVIQTDVQRIRLICDNIVRAVNELYGRAHRQAADLGA